MNGIKQKIGRMREIGAQMEELKKEKDILDAYFQRLAESALKNSKSKTVSWTADGCKVVAILAKKVILQYPHYITKVFADLADDIIKTETKSSLTTVGQRILGGICSGEYVEQTVDEVLEQVAAPEFIPLLKKKIKGKTYATDIKNLMAITGCSEATAAENAYLVAEAAVWQELKGIMIANKVPEAQWAEMVDSIKTGVVVEEHPKIRVETD